jgi:transcriptional regulator with XRE-family HTH domain
MSGVATEEEQRYRATHLGEVLEEQGRKRSWLAERAGVTGSYVTMIVSGERTVDQVLGERIAALLDVPFFLLFELRDRSNSFMEAE